MTFRRELWTAAGRSLDAASVRPPARLAVTEHFRSALHSLVDAPASIENQAVDLTILMPCLNEARTLSACIDKALAFIDRSGLSGEVLVADNGSDDGSQMVARSLGARVIHVNDRGYGNALIAGLNAARGRWVVMGDSDDSYDFSRLDEFIEALRDGAQLVLGNRFAGGIEAGAMPFLHRYLGNPVLSFLGRMLFGSSCRDFHCGLRAFDSDAIRALQLSAPGMEFASEMVVKATIQKLRIREVPTKLARDGRGRRPHLRSWRDGWRHLRFLFLFSPRSLFLFPGVVMAATGASAMLRLVAGPIIIGSVGFDINTLMYASAATVIGWQAMIFWICAKIHGVRAGILPRDPVFERLLEQLTLERILLVSSIVFLLGVVLAVSSVATWGLEEFGPLNPRYSMRLVIPSVTLMLLAIQSAYGALFTSFLRIKK
jgi:hypothetical protein